jgi:hypothetical protein
MLSGTVPMTKQFRVRTASLIVKLWVVETSGQ